MTTYDYKGFRPYGVGERFIIDGFASDEFEFNGNATVECIKNGAEFKIIDKHNANLIVGGMLIDFLK